MSFELSFAQPRRLIVKAAGGKLFLWTDDKPGGMLKGSELEALELITAGAGEDVVAIPYDDAVQLIWYILTNEDLRPNDPREKLLEQLKKAEIGPGYNGEGSRRIVPA